MNTVNQIASIDAGNVKPLVIMEDASVHKTGSKCGDSTCPCFEDETFTPLVVGPAFQGMMDSLLIEDSAHDRSLNAPLHSNRGFTLMR
jgi:hypothetical protein